VGKSKEEPDEKGKAIQRKEREIEASGKGRDSKAVGVVSGLAEANCSGSFKYEDEVR